MLKKQSEDLANALDEVQQASAVKSRFLASVSHELRTPLNGIIGFAELLHDGVIGPITSAQAACLSDILVCSDDLLRFVNAILAMTSLEGARPDLERDARASFLATPPNLLDRGHRPADA
jgi:signal transduction histidine kinase